MPKPFSAAEVAQALGISERTVYRAIKHSGLVKPSTQQKILDYIHRHYPDQEIESSPSRAKIITVVSQSKPKYFWQTMIDVMHQTLSDYPTELIRLRTVYFSGPRNEAELCSILAQISPNNTDALIVVPIDTPKCRQRIAELSAKIPVVIFDDYCDCGSDCFAVHGDGQTEGAEAADIVSLSTLSEKNILILHSLSFSCHYADRITGFRQRIAQYPSCRVIDELHLDQFVDEGYNYNTALPSMIARKLSNYFTAHPDSDINCLYVPDGIIAQLCAAQVKLKRTDIYCFGHEFNDSAQRFFDGGMHGGYVRGDIQFQSRTAIRLLADKLLYNREPEQTKYITPFSSALIEN